MIMSRNRSNARSNARRSAGLLAIAATMLAFAGAARADDELKLAVGAPNNWENQPAMLGQKAGIFKSTASRSIYCSRKVAARPCRR